MNLKNLRGMLVALLLLILLKVPYVKVTPEPAGHDASGNELFLANVDYRRWHPGYWLFLRCKVAVPVEKCTGADGSSWDIYSFVWPRWHPFRWFGVAT
jgi:hypothetical protein